MLRSSGAVSVSVALRATPGDGHTYTDVHVNGYECSISHRDKFEHTAANKHPDHYTKPDADTD
jgi:hypothetical protein